MENKMIKEKILHLTLKGEWFDMILSGEKKEEYREIKPYWIKRLSIHTVDQFEELLTYNQHQTIKFKDFTYVLFSHGYNKNRRQFKAKISDIVVSGGFEKWGAIKGRLYITICISGIEGI